MNDQTPGPDYTAASDYADARNYAARLLATTSDSVALIAELCGLTRRTFYRLFDEAYSMSPSDYRKAAKK